MAGIPSDASKARRGVRLRTVTAFPFESSAGQTMNAGTRFLSVVRTLSDSLRFAECEGWFEKLCQALHLRFALNGGSIEHFHEECEALLSLLYYSLGFGKPNHRNIETIFRYFLDKWFDGFDNYDLKKLILEIDVKYQTQSFACVLLLNNHLKFTLGSADNCSVLLQWNSEGLPAPEWLGEILSCSGNVYGNLKRILFKINYFDYHITFESDGCLKNLVTFLDACSKYKVGEYHDSLKFLSFLNDEECWQFLNGWKEIFCGLNLEHLGKFESAILKYKEALNQCGDCFYALFYCSRAFKENGSAENCLSCLKLLSLVKFENIQLDSSIQRILTTCLLPSRHNLSLRTTFLLATTNLLNKKWKDASEGFQSLLIKWDTVEENPAPRNSLLSPRDDLPSLPAKGFVTLTLGYSLMGMKDYENALFHLQDAVREDDDVLNNFERVGAEKKMEAYSAILCRQAVCECLHQQRNTKEAMTKCVRLMTDIELLIGSSSSWRSLILLTKACVYQLLSLLFEKVHKKENSIHFNRLKDHCLQQQKSEELTDEIDERFYEIVSGFLKEQLK